MKVAEFKEGQKVTVTLVAELCDYTCDTKGNITNLGVHLSEDSIMVWVKPEEISEYVEPLVEGHVYVDRNGAICQYIDGWMFYPTSSTGFTPNSDRSFYVEDLGHFSS